MVLQINGTTVVNADRSITLGTATPGTPVVGMMRYNSTLPEFQVYDGAQWVPFKKVTGSAATLYSWGYGNSGRLGDNTVVDKSSPVSVVGGFTDWTSVNSGGSNSIGCRANGTIWSWGIGAFGILGDGTLTDTSSPVLVAGGFTDWVDVSLRYTIALAVRANGTLWSWGLNGYGELGDNSNVAKSSPVAVAGGFTDWTSASAGNRHSLGLRANGVLYSWGRNNYGQLGHNSLTTASRSSPVVVVGGFTDWTSASAGNAHSIGVRANGTLWAWGQGSSGKLGDNTTVNKSSPVAVVGGFTDWTSASTGLTHSLGIRATGQLYAWGGSGFGELGDNSTTNKSSPVLVAGGIVNWVSMSAGNNHNLAIRSNGTLYAWGQNNYNGAGRLGDNSTTNKSSPVLVAGGFTDWVSASAGNLHSTAIRA